MKWLRKLLGTQNPITLIQSEPLDFKFIKQKCKPLSDKQISILKLMISNRENKGMDICSCDINRVLQMNCEIDNDLPTHLEGSD